jgi:hypothetical protein
MCSASHDTGTTLPETPKPPARIAVNVALRMLTAEERDMGCADRGVGLRHIQQRWMLASWYICYSDCLTQLVAEEGDSCAVWHEPLFILSNQMRL